MADKKTQDAMEEQAPSTHELVENLKQMIDEAEQMIVGTASAQVDETVAELRERLEEKLDQLREIYRDAEDRVVTTVSATDAAIREKPYRAVGIALGVGLLAGLWIKRGK